jgi:hypothetical protein
VSNAFSLFYANINISESSLGFVNNTAVQLSLIYTASHYLCNPYMYVRTHARCHNMWCVCVQILCTNSQYHEIYDRSEPSTSLAPTPSFHMLQKARYFIVAGVWIGCYKKIIMGRNSCGEMIISGVIVLCLNSAVRRINWGAVVRSLRSDKVSRKQPDEASPCRTNSVKCSCQSVRSAHLS